MPIETPQGNLDIKNATLRTSNLETQNIKIGSIFVGTGNSLEETANVGNSMSNTIQFTNTHTAFTTTGNVEVGGELTVSGNVSDLNVVSNVNLLHTSNTAALKLNSNVVTEFPRSKKLIKYPRVAMTQNDESGTSGYVAEQTNYSGYPTDGYAYRLFDNTSGAYQSGSVYSGGNPTASAPTTTASDGSTHQGVAITLDLVTKIRLDHVVFTSHANYGRTPVDGTFLGSNNSSTWDVIHTFSGLSTSSNNQKHTINITNSSQKLAYRYIRFVITKTHTSSVFNGGGLLEFRELEYYGTPEYDPEADGVDVVVKSVPNVPNTDWLEVYYDAKDLVDGSTTVNDLKPTGTANNGVANGNLSVSDGAFTFDGSGDYISSTITTTTGAFVHTFAFWMNIPSSASTTSSLVGFGTNSSDEASAIRFDGTEKLRWYFFGNDIKFATPNVRDKWVHVVGTYDGGNDSGLTVGNVGVNRKIFINTKETTVIENVSGSAGSDALDLLSTSHAFRVGSDLSNGNTLTGKIANVRLFNRALTQHEIYQLYAYQKEYFGHGVLGMTLKAGRLGIGTSEPKAALDVYGELYGPRTKPCFSIHTDDYWGADDVSWGTASGTHWATVYKTPIPCVRRGWLEYDTHNAISFRDVTRGSNTGTIVKFTAPRSGFYHFSFNIGFKTGVAGDYLAFMLNKNQEDSINGPDPNDYFLGVIHDHVTAKAYTLGVSVNIYLKAGEFVVPYSRSAQNIYICDGGGFNFSGFYIG